MAEKIKVKAPAKINITLDITGVRADGYHLMEMIMQTVNLYDILDIKLTDTKKIILKSNDDSILWDQTNLIYKGIESFYEKSGIPFSGVEVYTQKNIPSQAGLAGGSSNCGGVLYGLNILYNNFFTMEELLEISLFLGADVPFSMLGGTKLAEGIGEKLTVLKDMPNCFIVIAKPKMGVSTARCFKEYDTKKTINRPNTQKVIEAINKQDLESIAKGMANVFEEHCGVGEVFKIKQAMLNFNPLGAVMTGTGSAVFAIFKDEKTATICYNSLLKIADKVFITTPINKGVSIIED